MVDWGLVAVVIALLAYPLQAFAITPFLDFLGRVSARVYRWLWPPAGECKVLEWADFQDQSVHIPLESAVCTEPDCADESNAARRLLSGVWQQALGLLFPVPCQHAADRKTPKPRQLYARRQYIMTDPEVLLLHVHFSAQLMQSSSSRSTHHYYRGRSYPSFEDVVELRERRGVLVARMCQLNRAKRLGSYRDNFRSLRNQLHANGGTKRELEALLFGTVPAGAALNLMEGYPSWKQPVPSKLIAHPIRCQDDWRRGGWVVAVGMAYNRDQSSPLLRHRLRAQLEKSSFCYGRHRGDAECVMLPADVNTALGRVINTLGLLQSSAFPGHRALDEAVALASSFRRDGIAEYLTHDSGLAGILDGPLFRDPMKMVYMKDVSTSDCEFVVDLFRTRRVPSEEECMRLLPILKDVCCAAVIGMIRVFQFYAQKGFIVEPPLLRKYAHVYLEDSPIE